MENNMMCSTLCTFQNGENSTVQVLPDYDGSFENGNFDGLFHQYRGVIINSLVTAFGLDRILFVDHDGGNVQTMHNAENHIYSDNTFEKRGERAYNRNDYATATYMNKRRKKDFQNMEKLTDGYTGKDLVKDGSSHLEHIVSAKENHDNTAMRVLFTEDEMSKTINSDNNTLYTNASLNMSKNSYTMEEWANKQSKKDPTKSNAEFYDVNTEKAYVADANARKQIDAKVARRKLDHYSKSMAKDSLKQGSLMAIRQALGLVFTEAAMVVMDEMPELIKSMKNDFSLKRFFLRIGDIVKTAFKRVKEKKGDILEAIKSGFVSGIFTSITTTIINLFASTAKNIVRLIRQSMVSITEAVKILFFDKERRTTGERIIAASKVGLVGASTVLGVFVEQHLSESLVGIGSAIPVIGPILVDVISTFAGVLLTGLLSVSFIYYIDHSEKIKDLISFIDKTRENCFDSALNKMDEANRLIDSYIAKLCEIDVEQLHSKICELHDINAALKSSNTVALYNYCSNNNIILQFHDSEEFMSFMLDEDTILEI